MYDKLTAPSSLKPVHGNSAGAYLTMASSGALIFGIINIVGNFGTVFVDQAYWQKAVAARPRSASQRLLSRWVGLVRDSVYLGNDVGAIGCCDAGVSYP